MSPGIDSHQDESGSTKTHCVSIPPSLDTSTHGAVGGTRVLIASNKRLFYVILVASKEVPKFLSGTCFGFEGISGVPYKEPAPQAHLSSASEEKVSLYDLRG